MRKGVIRLSYKDKKVISIGAVSELTGLSIKTIRLCEDNKVVFPEIREGGVRKYSFHDVERLKMFACQSIDGLHPIERDMILDTDKRTPSETLET